MCISFEIFPYGDQGIIINFLQEISPEINKIVHVVSYKIGHDFNDKIIHINPAYCSVVLLLNTSITDQKKMIRELNSFLNTIDIEEKTNYRKIEIPICYSFEFGIDLEFISNKTNLSVEEIVHIHLNKEYIVYMMGFLPGFPFMGKVNDLIYCPRKKIPRLKVPKNSVGIAANQTGIYPSESPGGWQIIGKTPVDIYCTYRMDSSLFMAGDRVKFYEITKEEYENFNTNKYIEKMNESNVFF